MALDIDFVRSQFPGLSTDDVFLDNAGGSMTLQRVADRVRDYLLHTDVQLGATYGTSVRASERYRQARERLATFIGASRAEEVVFGPSSTILLKFLAYAIGATLAPDDEIVVTRIDHEANIGCWVRLESVFGLKVRFWEPNAESGDLDLADLEPLMNGRTKLVCFTHVSNILGTLHDVAEITRVVHEHGAEVCVDGVAFAPHRQLDVQAWDVDYYVFSLYKVYGPHHAILYGKYNALAAIDSVNHYFVERDRVPGKLEPGNANYELSWGAAGIVDYFDELGPHGWSAIAEHEQQLAEPLLAYLRGQPHVRIIGQPTANHAVRVPTISFVPSTMRPPELVERMDKTGIGIRFGHFYAARLIDQLGLGEDGVVRVSAVHYNTVAEIERLITALDRILTSKP